MRPVTFGSAAERCSTEADDTNLAMTERKYIMKHIFSNKGCTLDTPLRRAWATFRVKDRRGYGESSLMFSHIRKCDLPFYIGATIKCIHFPFCLSDFIRKTIKGKNKIARGAFFFFYVNT